MKILVTGAKGFIGKNLVAELRNRGYADIFEYDINTEIALLDNYAAGCDFVFHLAGVNRPEKPEEFMEGNFGFTSHLLEQLKKYNNKAPVLITSSTQAAFDNAYGKSKKAGEDLMFAYSAETGAPVFVYRLTNVFGKWCRPNYNSAVATFCHNIARGLPVQVNDPTVMMKLVYVDDVVDAFISKIRYAEEPENYPFEEVQPIHEIELGKIVELIQSFRSSRENLLIPNMSNAFVKKLYSTYLSYLPEDEFGYFLKMNTDQRGSFTEFIKTQERGQISVNISKPGITKGNHWHHTKNEKFLVVNGKGIIRFRKIDSNEVIEYPVSGEKLQVVDIPVGYTHNIENTGDTDMVTIMWANEFLNPDKPDTFFLNV